MKRELLKIGVVLEGLEVPRWTLNVLKSVQESGFAEISVIVNHSSNNKSDKPFVIALQEKFERFLYGERLTFLKNESIFGVIQNTPVFNIANGNHEFVEELSHYDLDVLINLSKIKIPDRGNKFAKYGIWEYWIQNQTLKDDFPAVYQSMLNKESVIVVSLQESHVHKHQVSCIHRSFLPTNFNSNLLNLEYTFGFASKIICRSLEGLFHYGYDYIEKQKKKYYQSNEEYSKVRNSFPSNIMAFFNWVLIITRFFISQLMNKEKWEWYLMYQSNAKDSFNNFSSYKALHPPKDCFWADPFVYTKNGSKYLFVEEYPYKVDKGHICLLELDKTGEVVQNEIILNRDYHLSYPLFFENEGEYYMIPETSENRTIEIYKSSDFPFKWEFVMNLMENVKAVDTTPFYYKDKWWLFTAIDESFSRGSGHVELFLYYSDNFLTNKWTPHPENPIVTDIRTARPGGKIFIQDGKIYRPSQDCSIRYGRALNMNQITVLNENEYCEVLLSKSEANWDSSLKGMHTYNSDKGFSIIDVYKY